MKIKVTFANNETLELKQDDTITILVHKYDSKVNTALTAIDHTLSGTTIAAWKFSAQKIDLKNHLAQIISVAPYFYVNHNTSILYGSNSVVKIESC